jgi:hypothetical protein
MVTIICDALREGAACGESALIHLSRYVYYNFMYGPRTGGRFAPILRETHHDIECPRCGKRTQVVKASA